MTEETRTQAGGVVVGADGSERGKVALAWAADAAIAHGLPLTVLFARPDATGLAHEVTEAAGTLGEALALVRDRQPTIEAKALQTPDAPVQSLLTAGETADFIVLGSRGIGGFRGLLVGSTTMHVAPYAHCPVVVVHGGPEAGGWVPEGEGNPGQVVLGYDGSSVANRASGFAFRHAAAIGTGVVVVTVERGKGEPEVHAVDPQQAHPGSDTGAFHSPILVTAGSFPDVPVSFVSGTGRPAEILLAESIGAALLVVGSRGKGGFGGLVMGSVSQKVVAHAQCPVAVLHPGVKASTAAGTYA
ncbi:MAG TPA: universal stress protein [Marmoricola sp.]|nr:universal stress protein [Marmoricola sp.]